jgi:drug/metabolite transporter (DMT)-like permease
MIAGGLTCSICFGCQLLIFKHVVRYTKDTFTIGFGFLFICGLLGLIQLIYEGLRKPDLVRDMSFDKVIFPLLIGLTGGLAIVISNIAGGIGIVGISNSIVHCNLVVTTVFNFLVLNQNISFFQMIGILMTVFGGILLALDDKLNKICFGGSSQTTDRDS